MQPISEAQLAEIFRWGIRRAGRFVEPLNAAMHEFEIVTPARQAAFIAQLAHESGEFQYVQEIASGAAYEGRQDLGNTEPGDGVRYKGRGLIQITGRANYQACGDALGADLVGNPERLEEPELACRSAAWFWTVGAGLRLSRAAIAAGCEPGCNLNEYADSGDMQRITYAINGGLNGMKDRLHYYERAQRVLAAA